MTTNPTNPHQPATPALPTIPQAARMTAFHAGADVSTPHSDRSLMIVAGLEYVVTKGGLARLKTHIRSIESWIRHYAAERRTLRKQGFVPASTELTRELRRLFADRRAMVAGSIALHAALTPTP